MCKAFEDYKAEEREEGKKEGELSNMQKNLKNLMKNLDVSFERAMQILEIPAEYKEELYSLMFCVKGE